MVGNEEMTLDLETNEGTDEAAVDHGELTVPQSFGAKAPPKRYVHVQGPETARALLDVVAESFPDSHRDAKRSRLLIELGAVYVNRDRTVNPEIYVNKKDLVRIHLEPRRYKVNPRDLNRRIVEENEDFIVINKPSGLPMHPTLDNVRENLAHGLDKKVFVTHRLDVPTSGLVVLARTKQYQSVFNKVLQNRQLTKIYQAFVHNPVPTGLLRHFMRKTVRAPKEVVRELPPSQKNFFEECLMKVISCEAHAGGHMVTMELLTGRTHQIRAQLADMGAPIAGDEMYGGRPADFFGLHAAELHFTCPTTQKSYHFKSRPDSLALA